MSKHKNKYLLLILALVVFFTAFGAYCRYLYVEKLEKIEEQLLPTSEAGFFNFFNAQKIINLRGEDKDKTGILIEIKPGSEFTGSLALKNHEKISHTYQIKVEPFPQNPEIELSLKNAENIEVGPKKLQFFEYVLKVPKDIPEGDYSTLISASATDDDSKKIKSDNFIFNLAIGLKVYLKVSDNPYIYQYENPSVLAKNNAYNFAVQRGGLILGVFFVILTCYFLFMGFQKKLNNK